MSLHPMELENIFDRLQVTESLELWKSKDETTHRQLKILHFIEGGDWTSSLVALETLFSDTNSLLIKIFCIQWAIGISETIFDLPLRNRWIDQWKECPDWSLDPWGRFLNRFQSAVQCYFDQSLTDAERLFKANLAESEALNYPRATARCLFHLGLIYKTWGQTDRALDFFNKANSIATEHSLFRTRARIEEQEKLLLEGIQSGEHGLAVVEKLLMEKKFRAARKQVLLCCRKRRSEKRTWAASSENAYLALVCYAFQQAHRFNRLLRTINDNLVLETTLRMASKIAPLPLREKSQLDYLQSLSGFSQIQRSADMQKVTIGTKTITQAEDREVTIFLHSLIEKEQGLTKNDMAQLLWQTAYDPLYHDPKIYRVIHRARKWIGLQDFIINKYGLYLLGTHLR